MSEQIKNSSFQQHLTGGSVELLESKLGIKACEGFPQSWEMKEKFPWDSDEDFNEFVSYCKDANALSSNMGHIRMATSYRSYIVYYKGKYYVQVNTCWKRARKHVSTALYVNYLDALLFIKKIVFG